MRVRRVGILIVLVIVALCCVSVAAAFIWTHTTRVTISNTVAAAGSIGRGSTWAGWRLWFPAAFEVVELCERWVFSGHVCGSDVSLQQRGKQHNNIVVQQHHRSVRVIRRTSGLARTM